MWSPFRRIPRRRRPGLGDETLHHAALDYGATGCGTRKKPRRTAFRREAYMETYGWVDQPKGIVRLTVERAMELTVDGGKDPASAHKELIAREEKATFVSAEAARETQRFRVTGAA